MHCKVHHEMSLASFLWSPKSELNEEMSRELAICFLTSYFTVYKYLFWSLFIPAKLTIVIFNDLFFIFR